MTAAPDMGRPVVLGQRANLAQFSLDAALTFASGATVAFRLRRTARRPGGEA